MFDRLTVVCVVLFINVDMHVLYSYRRSCPYVNSSVIERCDLNSNTKIYKTLVHDYLKLRFVIKLTNV